MFTILFCFLETEISNKLISVDKRFIVISLKKLQK